MQDMIKKLSNLSTLLNFYNKKPLNKTKRELHKLSLLNHQPPSTAIITLMKKTRPFASAVKLSLLSLASNILETIIYEDGPNFTFLQISKHYLTLLIIK